MATLSQVLVFANTYLFPSLLMSPREIIFIVIHKLTMCTPHDLTKTKQVTMTTIKQPILIRKTIMTPNGLSLSLPDFKVNISKASKSSFEFYTKKNSKAIIINSPPINNTGKVEDHFRNS